MIGRVLGHYRVESKLGKGGMGEVYRARDTRLDRSVAIKIIAPGVAQDPGFRARFEREARTISTLEHPNICALYDVGDVDGTSFLVMQHLEGETLAARLRRGALPVDQALRYASEIAAALSHAHRNHVIHRDLKPGNVMLTAGGAQLLDFGLAKRTMAGAHAETGVVDSTATVSGTIVGTVQYMAPEQIEGRAVDARTDIFAFGAVLFEMLTGRHAFTGATPAALMGAILRDVPPLPSSVVPSVPKALDHIVQRCLAKEPDERWASAHDLWIELSWMRSAAQEASTAIGEPRGKWKERAAWATIAAFLTAVAVYGWPISRPSSSTPHQTRFLLSPPPNVPWNYWGTPIVSPDGRYVAMGTAAPYKGQAPREDPLAFSLWIRPMEGVEFRRVEGVIDFTLGLAAWSADSRWVVFPDRHQLKRAAVSGGSAEVIGSLPMADEFAGATVNADGVVLVGYNGGPLHRVPLSGGTLQPFRPLDTARGEVGQSAPFFLPDGQRFLFVSRSRTAMSVKVAALGSPQQTELIAEASDPWYAPPGMIVFLRGGRPMVQRFDLSRLAVQGVAQPIEVQRHPETSAGSTTGTLIYRAQLGGSIRRHGDVFDANTRLAWFDRAGREVEPVAPLGAYINPELSPNTRFVAVEKFDNENDGEIWTYDLKRRVGARLTSDPLRDSDPVWSPRGDRIAWSRSRWDGKGEVWVQHTSGTEPPVVVRTIGDKTRPAGPFIADWSPDGRYLAAVWMSSAGASGVEIVSVDGSHAVAWPRSEFGESQLRFSPDGRWVAYVSTETGSPEVYVKPFPPHSVKVRVSLNGGMQPQWHKNGKELFYLAPDRTLMSVGVRRSIAALDFDTPVPLFKAPVPMPGWGRSHYQVSPDGTRFLLTVLDTSKPSPSPDVVVVLGWAQSMYDELTR